MGLTNRKKNPRNTFGHTKEPKGTRRHDPIYHPNYHIGFIVARLCFTADLKCHNPKIMCYTVQGRPRAAKHSQDAVLTMPARQPKTMRQMLSRHYRDILRYGDLN